jgi:hypothetical protein
MSNQEKVLSNKDDLKLEEWDEEFMWSPKTMLLYDRDNNKIGRVIDINNAEIEFFDDEEIVGEYHAYTYDD